MSTKITKVMSMPEAAGGSSVVRPSSVRAMPSLLQAVRPVAAAVALMATSNAALACLGGGFSWSSSISVGSPYTVQAGGTFTVSGTASYNLNGCGVQARVRYVSGDCTPTGATGWAGNGGICSGSGGTASRTYTMGSSPTSQCVVIAEGTDTCGDYHSTSYTVNVTGTAQSIVVDTAAPAGPRTYLTTFNVAAHSTSGLPVAVTTDGTGCTGSGTTSGAGSPVTITMNSGTTSCTVYYNQSGGSGWFAAPQVTSTTSAAKASQSITVTTAAPASAQMTQQFNVAATAPGGTVTIAGSGGCSGSGSGSATLTMTSGSAACTVTYSQAGSVNYSAASNVVSTTSATMGNQSINVTTAPPASGYSGQTFTVAAQSLSTLYGAATGLGVSIAASGGCSGSGTNSATIQVTSGTVDCTITYSQPGQAGLWNAATTVTNSVSGVVGCPDEGIFSSIRLADSGYLGWACKDLSSCGLTPGLGYKGHVLATANNPGKTFMIKLAPDGSGFYNIVNLTDNTCWTVGDGVYEFSGTRTGSNSNAGYLTAIQDTATLSANPPTPCDLNNDHAKWQMPYAGSGYFNIKTDGNVAAYTNHCIGTTGGLPYLIGFGNGNWADTWVRNAAPSCGNSGARISCGGYAGPLPNHVRFEFNPEAVANLGQPVTIKVCTNAREAVIGNAAPACTLYTSTSVVLTPIATEVGGSTANSASWSGLTAAPQTTISGGSSAGITLTDTEAEGVSFSYSQTVSTMVDSVLECVNTVTGKIINCAYTVSGTGMEVGTASFEALEQINGTTLTSNHLYTKLANVAFPNSGFNLVAVRTALSGGAKSVLTTYNRTPTSIELVDATTGTGCSDATALKTASPTQASFSPALPAPFANGVLNVTPTVIPAYSKLWVRFKDTAISNSYFCSTDSFTVRPTELSLALDNNANDPHVAGQYYDPGTGVKIADPGATYFTLTVTARSGWNAVTSASTGNVASGYVGSPTVELGNVQDWDNSAIASGVLTTNGPTSNPPTFDAAGGVTAANRFYYDDFGTVSFKQANTVVDKTFAETNSSDKSNTDCDSTTSPYSNTVNVAGKYGCYVGGPETTLVSKRFRPYTYSLASSVTSATAPDCKFTYVGKNFGGGTFTLKALSAHGTALSRLSSLAPNKPTFTVTPYDGATAIADATFSPALTAAAWTGGQYTLSLSDYKVQTGAPIGHYDGFILGATVTDSKDQVRFGTSAAADCSDGSGHNGTIASSGDNTTCIPPANGATSLRYGIVKLENAYGSEQLPLDVAINIYYWKKQAGAAHSWAPNDLDNCTTLLANGNNFAFGNFTGGLATAGEIVRPTLASAKFTQGRNYLRFAAPTTHKTGSFDLVLNLGAAAAIGNNACLWTGATPPDQDSLAGAGLLHLAGNWCGGSYNRYPSARITFGAAKSPFLYRRERY